MKKPFLKNEIIDIKKVLEDTMTQGNLISVLAHNQTIMYEMLQEIIKKLNR